MIIQLKQSKVAADLPLPAYQTELSAGVDLQAALIELSYNQFKWMSSKYNLFSISPIKEAMRKLNGEVPFNRDSIESSGFIPFTIKKFSDMYPELDNEELKNIEIDWWVDFFESGKSIHDELSKTGINFIKVY